jgi:hypothetical protein
MGTVINKISSLRVVHNQQIPPLCLQILTHSVIEKLAKTKDVPLGEISPKNF